jgi:BirA family transcriptional regulator, biotin operon repressor / biotin---[acetyl-CoA-carboxylase] ligase
MADIFTPTILRFDSLASTNTEAARQAAAGAAEGLVVVAREQTAGRGRQRRAWSSPRDAGVYMSVVLRPRLRADEWPLLALASALAASDALEEACGLRTDIKWPNDLLSGGRKLCGILAETVESGRGRACVVGIGINLKADAYPDALRASATSTEEETGARADTDSLIESLVRAVARRYARLQSEDGAPATLREWRARSSYAQGKRVRVRLDGESFEGVTRGLEPDGALRVELEGGAVRIVRAGDVEALRAAD